MGPRLAHANPNPSAKACRGHAQYRKAIWWISGVLGFAVTLGLALQKWGRSPMTVAAERVGARALLGANSPAPKTNPEQAQGATGTVGQLETSSRVSKKLTSLWRPDRTPLTAEAAVAWDEMLAELVAEGPDAVPTIREFLSNNTNNDWSAAARRVLGYNSAREAMFDALLKIGGPEAESALASMLGGTEEPREIALLARNLDKLAPGQYRRAAVAAAEQALFSTSSDTVQVRDVAPLFEVLSRFGDSTILAELEKAASRWNYYATMAMAQMPDGAGIPALVRLAEEGGVAPGPAADPAIRMLASLAQQNDDARAAFLGLLRNNKIPNSAWEQLAPILAGAQVQIVAGVFGGGVALDYAAGVQKIHLSYGNQNFLTGMPAESGRAAQWERQLEWLDQMSAVATVPAAQSAIHEAWTLLLVRLGHLTSSVR
jgi:hypothetical protein